MYQVRCGFSRLSVAETVQKADRIINNLENNPNFPSLPISIDVLKETIQLLKAEQGEVRQRNYRTITLRNQTHDKIKNYMARTCAYINVEAQGDVEKLNSSGFELRKERSKATTPERIKKLSCKNNPDSGSIRISWKGISARDYYMIRYTYDPSDENAWVFAGVATKLFFNIENLHPGKRVYLSVSAVNNAGQSNWSNTASLMVA